MSEGIRATLVQNPKQEFPGRTLSRNSDGSIQREYPTHVPPTDTASGSVVRENPKQPVPALVAPDAKANLRENPLNPQQ